jgi:hypothetical protein
MLICLSNGRTHLLTADVAELLSVSVSWLLAEQEGGPFRRHRTTDLDMRKHDSWRAASRTTA